MRHSDRPTHITFRSLAHETTPRLRVTPAVLRARYHWLLDRCLASTGDERIIAGARIMLAVSAMGRIMAAVALLALTLAPIAAHAAEPSKGACRTVLVSQASQANGSTVLVVRCVRGAR